MSGDHFPGQTKKISTGALSVPLPSYPLRCACACASLVRFLARPATAFFFFSPYRPPRSGEAINLPHTHLTPPPLAADSARGDQTWESHTPPLSPAALAMPGLAAEHDAAVSLVRRVARTLNRRVTDIVALLFNHKVK